MGLSRKMSSVQIWLAIIRLTLVVLYYYFTDIQNGYLYIELQGDGMPVIYALNEFNDVVLRRNETAGKS